MTGEVTLEEQEEIERIFVGFAVQAQKQLSSKIHKPRQRVIVLAGPTAAGKTQFSIDLAKQIGGEVVSADSIQVYRGMDIGTAKITEEEMEGIPHHLINVRDVKDTYNVVDFYYEARHCCQKILARDAVPIIVGGSGFYIHSLIYGPPSGPPSVPELRKMLEDEMERFGPEAMYQKLRQLDPQYANTITKNDKQKIVRAFEIIKLTGKKVSKLSWKGRRKPQNYDFRSWFLYRPKEHLYKRIDKRCDKMIEEGFLDEVRRLETEGLRENSSAAQAIGYRQALDFLETEQTKCDLKQFTEKFKQASRNYAKRQFTWFRREPAFRWLDLDLHDHEVALEMVMRDYEAR
ncbi:MAG: tRNA (adenosine(37)-N6)-dimethylallyltransferase MiaA [Chlamydiales bacterium]|nr:tRNA (adenosine(37)-N6)-dimethylallyltransferase MiaA [Chlamydiia bacterium]MCP5507268.1 tRNA (adenosine(37)-N6)-dimethylallyltransferase MiaA [Chlamydiales bacterium]